MQALRDRVADLEREKQELLRANSLLRASEARLGRVLEGSEQGYWDWDLTTQEFYVSERYESMLGYALGERQLSPENWPRYVHPDDLPKAAESLRKHLAGLTPCHEVEIRCLTKSGEWKYVLTRGKIVKRADDGTPLMMAGTHTDIAARKQAEQQLLEQSALLDLANDAIIVRDLQNNILYWNRGAEQTYGWTSDQARQHVTHQLLQTKFPIPLAEIEKTLFHKDSWEGELEHSTRDGARIVVASRWALKRDGNGRPLAIMEINRDITERNALLAQLKLKAHEDYLTGLNNRGYFMEQAELELKRASRYGNTLAVLMLDIDNFKAINDNFGHATGDLVLKALADIFRKTLRDVDIVGRVGGEEFAVLLPEIDKEEASVVAERLRSMVEHATIALQHRAPLRFTVSIGISVPSSEVIHLHTLLSQADDALYRAKHAGRNQVSD